MDPKLAVVSKRRPLRQAIKECELRWFHETAVLAQEGEPQQMALLAHMYTVGYGCKADADEARKWFDEASKQLGYNVRTDPAPIMSSVGPPDAQQQEHHRHHHHHHRHHHHHSQDHQQQQQQQTQQETQQVQQQQQASFTFGQASSSRQAQMAAAAAAAGAGPSSQVFGISAGLSPPGAAAAAAAGASVPAGLSPAAILQVTSPPTA